VWSVLCSGIRCLFNIFDHSDNAELLVRFKKFVVRLLEPIASKYGWEPKPDEDTHKSLTRAQILSCLAKCGHEPTIKKALELFKAHVTSKQQVVPDLRDLVYGMAAQKNPHDAIDQLKHIIETDPFSGVVLSAVSAIGQCSTYGGLDKVYEYAIDEKKIRSQDYATLFAGSQAHKIGQEFTWCYFKKNVENLKHTFGSVNSAIFQRVLKFVASSKCSENDAKDVENFCKTAFDEHSQKILERPIKQTTESIRLNAQMLKKNAEPVDDYLKALGL